MKTIVAVPSTAPFNNCEYFALLSAFENPAPVSIVLPHGPTIEYVTALTKAYKDGFVPHNMQPSDLAGMTRPVYDFVVANVYTFPTESHVELIGHPTWNTHGTHCQ